MTENQGAGAPPRKDLVAAFKEMPPAEKLLAVAAVAVLLGFIVANLWRWLFKYTWFPTCAFLGAAGVLVLILLDLLAVKVMDAKSRTYVMIGLAVLPALGYVVDQFSNFWGAVMLAGAIVMGVAGAKITTREQIIKRR
jgi:hypothetical protein